MSSSPSFKGKKVLITGASGFIGARLLQRLLEEGAQIYALLSNSGSYARLDSVLKDIRCLKGDVTDFSFLKPQMGGLQPQVIYHLAGYGNHPQHYGDPEKEILEITRGNVLGTAALLAALVPVKFECLIHTGTAAEYGPRTQAMREDQLLKPDTYYGATKAGATLLCQAFSHLLGRKVITLRPSYVYGPEEDLDRFIPTVIRSCLENKVLPLTSVHEKKDFVFIDDVVEAYLCAYRSNFSGTPVVNIGSSRETTLGEVIGMIEKQLGKKLQYVQGSYQSLQWKSSCWQADITQAKEILNWTPAHDLEKGLKKTIDWVRAKETS